MLSKHTKAYFFFGGGGGRGTKFWDGKRASRREPCHSVRILNIAAQYGVTVHNIIFSAS